MPHEDPLSPGYVPASSIAGTVFPSFPDPTRALSLALLSQLDRTQWWPPEVLRAQVLRQLEQVVGHAARTTVLGKASLGEHGGEPLTWERFEALPLLPRRTLQASRAEMTSSAPPASHGTLAPAETSGSTGTPVVVERTALTHVIWNVLTAREHQWHRRDTSEMLAVVRHAPGADYPAGTSFAAWGPGASLIGPPGPCAMLHIGATTAQQVAWLQARPAAWLLHYPSGIRDLLRATERAGVRFPKLRGVRTFGEVVTQDLRDDVRATWDVPVHDTYSTQELGYVAFECPEQGKLHVQSESVLIEILRADNTACEPGEVGRVVATSLHNFAMPLIRYDIGDHAAWGPPCACGRGLPVLDRVLGRVHQTFLTASGDQIWLTVGVHKLRGLGPVVQHQLVQSRAGELQLRLVGSRPATAAEDAGLLAHMRANLPPGTEVTLRWVDEIPRTRSGKFLDFVSQLPRDA